MENEGENETAPLLGRARPAQSGAPTAEARIPWYQLRRPWPIGLAVILAAALWAVSLAIVTFHVIADDPFVERDLVRLNTVIHYVCSLLVAVPFGVLADRARKPVYALASAGQMLSVAWLFLVAVLPPTLPRALQLLAGLGQLLGGGLLLVNVVHVAVLADVLPPAQRLLGFLALNLVQEPAFFVAFGLAGPLRELYSPLPLVLALVLALLGASLVLFLLPETARGPRPPRAEQDGEDWWSRSKACLHLRFRDFGPALAVARSPNVLWVVLALATYTLAAQGYQLTIYEYIWTHSNVNSNVVIVTMITRCLTVGLLLPALAIMLVHPNGHARFTGFQRDIVLGRTSAVLAIVGVLLTFIPAKGLSVVGTIAVGLSTGLPALCDSLISSVTPASGYATVYSLESALSTLISVVLTPFFYRSSSPASSPWFLIVLAVIVALLYVVILAALFQLKVRSAGPGNVVEAQPEGVRGDEGSVVVNDEGQV